MTELDVYDIIRKVYNKEYLGKTRVELLQPFGYKVSLYLNKPEHPFVIAALLGDEDFKRFFELELKYSHLDSISYFLGEQILPYIEFDCLCKNCGKK